MSHPVDPTRPTIIFAGESIMCGFGLPWAQSIPTLVAAGLRRQSANLAVFGYANDQNLMRLRQEVPRFTRPSAVVILFSPGLVFRDLDTDRPHLGPGQNWSPAAPSWRLKNLAAFYIPYHGAAAIDRLIATTRAQLTADVMLAKIRGARPLIVIPQFGSESPSEKVLRQRILDDGRLPYVKVYLDPTWRISRDVHPNAQGARAIADAIIAKLGETNAGAESVAQTNGPG